MRKTVTIAALLLSSLPLWGADCSCVVPIEPKVPCVAYCRNALLKKMTKGELTDIVKLDEKTASDIVTLRQKTDPKAFEVRVEAMPKSDEADLQTKFGKIDPDKFTELVKKYNLTTIKAVPDAPRDEKKKMPEQRE